MFKTQESLIQEIHNEFDSAQDRLLEQAKQIILSSKEEGLTPEEKQAERLKKVGFTNVPLVKRAETITKKREKSKKVVVKSEDQARTIQYYSTAYPFLKFLTEEELDRICDKYNLIYAPIDCFTGEVPDKNLSDIENAQTLKTEDKVEVQSYLRGRDSHQFRIDAALSRLGLVNSKITTEDVNRVIENSPYMIKRGTVNLYKNKGLSENTWLYLICEYDFQDLTTYWFDYTGVESTKKDGLFIAAPSKDFNLKGLEKKTSHGFFSLLKTEVKDPIVFRYVKNGLQVISKWGLEASDPSLLLPINN